MTRKKIKEIDTADTEELKNQGRMTNAERDRKIKEAEGLYIRGFSLQSISEFETIGIRVKTLQDWKKRYDWDTKKQLHNISPSEIKAMIRSNIAAIKLGKQMPYKPDDIAKMAKAWKEIDDERKKQSILWRLLTALWIGSPIWSPNPKAKNERIISNY